MGGHLHVLVVMDGARRRVMARVTRGNDGELVVNLQSNGNSKQQQQLQQQQRNADDRIAKQQRSFERSERHRARTAAEAATATILVDPETTNGFQISESRNTRGAGDAHAAAVRERSGGTESDGAFGRRPGVFAAPLRPPMASS